jgi:hypothetical protein
MVEFSRRRFLKQASIGLGAGVAVAGVAASLPRLGQPAPAATPAPQPGGTLVTAAAVPGIALSEPMVVHVRSGASGEIAVLVGTQEIVYRDLELVARLAQRASVLGEA